MTRPVRTAHRSRLATRGGRRRTVGVLAALVGVLSLVVSCSSDGDDRGSSSSGETVDGASTEPPAATAPPPTTPIEEPVRLGSFDPVVPAPVAVEPGVGSFALRVETVVVVDDALDGQADDAVALLRSSVGPSSGLELPVRPAADGYPAITFRPAPAAGSSPDGVHRVVVSETGVAVEAADHDGFVWAVQTLLQALPPEVHAAERQPGTFALPVGAVDDAPRFAWRGAMLDITRHWFGPDDIEAFVDQLSAYKLNRLHLHLSDDQGWRIEIRSHPELATVGGASQVGGGPGGFLTQDEYRDLVAYAAARGVTIVPEIDTPGHTNAALHAIAELNCDGVAPDPYTGTQVGFSSLCISKDLTYEWFDDVIRELAELTPGPWIHLGGDESHSTDDADYRRFVARAAAIVREHAKTPVGWEEIGTADLGGDAVVQHWREEAPTLAGAEQGASVVLSPAPKVYLDMKHVDAGPGNVWAGVIPTEVAYDWDPATLVTGLAADRVLGVEAPLWTELITDRTTIQERTLPRLPAVAEVAWSEQRRREWADFAGRIGTHGARWDARGWAWTRDPGIDWPT